MISPEIQWAAINAHCARRGYEIAASMEGIDESGSRARSAWWPRLDQACARVEAGEFDVVVVWKFHRTARNRRRWAVAVDRIESAGGLLESATEDVDVRTSTGRLTRGVLAELGAWQAEVTGEVWKEVHARRVAAGKPANGKPRFGYLYDRETKLHVPDPVTGPVLADVYRRYVAGESVYQLVRWLNARGFRTIEAGVWSERTLRRVMDSGFAAGKFIHGGVLHDGAHEPLIDPALWQAYQDARVDRRARPARTGRSQYLLSGLVRCGRCGGSMVAGEFGHAHAPKYRCRNGKEVGPAVCSGGYVMASYVERIVLEWLATQASDVEAAAAAELAANVRVSVGRSEVERLSRELLRVEEALTRLVVQEAESPEVPGSVFASARQELMERHRVVSDAVESAGRDVRSAEVDPGAAARELLGVWETSPVELRREMLRRLVGRVVVWSGRPQARVEVVPVWGGFEG